MKKLVIFLAIGILVAAISAGIFITKPLWMNNETEELPGANEAEELSSWTKEPGIRISGISSCTIFKDNQYWMYYTGQGIKLAKSFDGLDFEDIKTVVDVPNVSSFGINMVSNPSVFETNDGKYRMIFEGSKMSSSEQTDRKLYSAVSSEGLNWEMEEGVRFQDEGDKPGETFTSVPEIIRLDNGKLRMYYTRGMTSSTALSEDDGLTWTKEANLQLGKIAVDLDIVRLNNSYKLFFTTFADEFGVGEQWVASASSEDGINFVLDNSKLIEPDTTNSLITDPDVIKISNGYRMYYGEFTEGSPDSSIKSAFSSG